MSLRLEMLQVARVAPKVLGDSAELVAKFLASCQHHDGGFVGRDGRSDLYYTVFCLDGLMALQGQFQFDAALEYMNRWQGGQGLDFVHLCCLARAWGTLHTIRSTCRCPQAWSTEILHRIEEHRTVLGGYHPLVTSAANPGTAYGAFLACGAYQDLGGTLPKSTDLVESLSALRSRDGAWGNERTGDVPPPLGATNSTAAAVLVMRQLGVKIPPEVGAWLEARHHKPSGGFLAIPGAPIPDLLSTATALHALSGMAWNLAPLRESTLDFVDSLWTNQGGFHGHWTDDHLDAEYTYYGLLTLGHLA